MKIKNKPSLYTIFFCINIGVIIALKPSINHKLKIFDHITFHTDKDQLPLIAAITDKNNSGADVPIAIIVNHINKGEIRKYLAILTLELIRWFAANQSTNNQIDNNISAENIFYDSSVK